MRSQFYKIRLVVAFSLAASAAVCPADDAELLRLLRNENAQPSLQNRVSTPMQSFPQDPNAGRIVQPPVHQNKLFSRKIEGAPIGSQKIAGPKLPTPDDRIQPVATPSWQKKYTVGPGDTLNISAYDRSDLAREVAIAPDGTISYLQAIGVKVEGLTLREVRDKLTKALTGHKQIKLIVTPGTIGSKRIAVIGRVREPGSFPLDRPTSILEAIAAANGIEVGSVGGSAFELADLDHSFVARNGRKLSVDLSKLYFQGDFSQNAMLEPDDYVFIASSLRNEYYILGAVNNPSRRKMPTKMTVLRAISDAGGYETKAFKTNVLLIRGSIHKPETQVINVHDILTGKSPDVEIQNRDILYVHRRPFYIAEDALDSALVTFVQTVSAEVINQNYNPISISAD